MTFGSFMSKVGRGIGQAALGTQKFIGQAATKVNQMKQVGNAWLDKHPGVRELGTIANRIAVDAVPGLGAIEDVVKTGDQALSTANRIVGNQSSSGGFSNQQIGSFVQGALKRAGGPLADKELGDFAYRQAQRLPGDSGGYKMPKLDLSF
jgi:hypothetical protein